MCDFGSVNVLTIIKACLMLVAVLFVFPIFCISKTIVDFFMKTIFWTFCFRISWRLAMCFWLRRRSENTKSLAYDVDFISHLLFLRSNFSYFQKKIFF